MTENIGLFKQVEIQTNGSTVWVNTERGCIGRFCGTSYEIFRQGGPPTTIDRDGAPLLKTHWRGFVEKMKRIYKLEIPEQYMPRRFRG